MSIIISHIKQGSWDKQSNEGHQKVLLILHQNLQGNSEFKLTELS